MSAASTVSAHTVPSALGPSPARTRALGRRPRGTGVGYRDGLGLQGLFGFRSAMARMAFRAAPLSPDDVVDIRTAAAAEGALVLRRG